MTMLFPHSHVQNKKYNKYISQQMCVPPPTEAVLA